MDQGLRFAIREGSRTVGAGVVTEVINRDRNEGRAGGSTEDPHQTEVVRPSVARQVREGHRRDG
jgi:hypothetical protein